MNFLISNFQIPVPTVPNVRANPSVNLNHAAQFIYALFLTHYLLAL